MTASRAEADQPSRPASEANGADARIRPMRWWDIAGVAAIDSRVFGTDSWSVEAFWAELATPGRYYWVLEVGGETGGYGGIFVSGADADVATIGVADTHRGRGFGRDLMDHLLAAASDLGAARMFLEVRPDNAAARGLYDSLGFEAAGIRRGYYQPDGADALVMRRRL